MKVSQHHIDYWQPFYPVHRGLMNRFGIRVRNDLCWALVQVGDQEANTFGEPYAIPVDLSAMPRYLQIIVEGHTSDFPDSDLLDVLAGRKTFEEATGSAKKMEPKRMSARVAAGVRYAS